MNVPHKHSWVQAIQKAAAEQGISLPVMTAQGMGNLMLRNTSGDRQVFLKRRLAPSSIRIVWRTT